MPLCIFLHFFPQKRLNYKRFKKTLVLFPRNRFLPNQSTQLKSYFLRRISKTLFCVTAHNQKRRVIPKRQTAPRFLTVHTFCLQNSRLHCFTKRRLSLRENYLLSNIPSCFVQKKNAYCACVLTLCSYVFQP